MCVMWTNWKRSPGRNSEVGSQKSEVRSRKSEVGSRKSEVRSWKAVFGFRNLQYVSTVYKKLVQIDTIGISFYIASFEQSLNLLNTNLHLQAMWIDIWLEREVNRHLTTLDGNANQELLSLHRFISQILCASWYTILACRIQQYVSQNF